MAAGLDELRPVAGIRSQPRYRTRRSCQCELCATERPWLIVTIAANNSCPTVIACHRRPHNAIQDLNVRAMSFSVRRLDSWITNVTDRQTGLLWQYRAVHYSASRGRKDHTV